MLIISVRAHPQYADAAIQYFQSKWASQETQMVYEDCIKNCLKAEAPLPQWYLLYQEDEIIGCAGLITNDFISRMDLYPWICALYIEQAHRGNHYGALLLEKAKSDTKAGGFSHLHLCTDHIGYYEQYGFKHMGTGYHRWGKSARIYSIKV